MEPYQDNETNTEDKMNPQRKEATSFLWKPLFNELIIWSVVSIILGFMLAFSGKLASWLSNSSFIKALDSLGKLSVLVAVIAFLRHIPRWKYQAREEAKKRRFVSLRQNGVGTVYFRADAILPKGHTRVIGRRLWAEVGQPRRHATEGVRRRPAGKGRTHKLASVDGSSLC
jgi:hypothetical protein